MNLHDFEKLARKSTGLVPVVLLQDVTPHFKGATIGLFPKDAMDYVEKELAAPLGRDGEPIKVAKKKTAQPKPSPKNPAGDVVIPDNWRDLHHLQMIPIASEISGEKVAKKDEAIAIIELELERRKTG